MTPDDEAASSQAWLARAKGNLSLAQGGYLIQGIFLEDLCFNTQQAAEKALKAVCVQYALDFPKTHSLVSLMDFLEAADIQIPEQVKEADILTQFAVRTRYPGWIEPVTEQEYLEALALAQAVVNWAVSLISQLNDNRKS